MEWYASEVEKCQFKLYFVYFAPYNKRHKGGEVLKIIAEGDSIVIRKMEARAEDFQLFLRWMTDPETMKYWEGMTEHFTYERVVKKYWQTAEEKAQQCIIEYNQLPIGFCQFYQVLSAADYEVPDDQYRKFVAPSEIVYGIDIFLGEVSFRNRGIGTQSIILLLKALFETMGADIVLIDPKVHNARAIRCYHKAGFEDYFIAPHRELQDGIYHDSLIMGVRTPNKQDDKD